MLAYEPDETLAHRLDPRAKLAFQVGFAVAAIGHGEPRALLVLTGVTALVLASARVSPVRALYAYRFALLFLLVSPLVAAVSLGPPWIDVDDGTTTALASYGVLLLLLVSAAYVRSTPVRESRAAIQRTLPGRTGATLGVGIALVFRFLPILAADLRRIREAEAARLGTERGAVERARVLGTAALVRVFERADRLSVAMQARCFAWNPTLPRLSFSWVDLPVIAVGIVLGVSMVVG